MEDWVLRALARWPNVPDLYGWLQLDRRGRWRIRGELISRPQILLTLNRNYAADERGCWFFQNGPQRGFVTLDAAPWIVGAVGDRLETHAGDPVTRVDGAWLDEAGSLWLKAEQGPALLRDDDLAWLLDRLRVGSRAAGEAAVETALAQAAGQMTPLSLDLAGTRINIGRLDSADIPAALGFVREPQPPAATVSG